LIQTYKIKIALFFLIFFVIRNNFSQNKQVLYNFAELPQTLLLNPGSETNYKFHIGVPLLSGVSTKFGTSNFVISDLFLDDNISINDKVSEVLKNVSTKDYAESNLQVEVFNAGFKLNNNNYFSFGFYEEFNGIIYAPKDILTLISEGNSAYLNKSFSLSQMSYKVDFLGVLHFGLTRKVSKKLTYGGRLKIYSSALNIESFNNSGTFTTVNGSNTMYTQYLDNINIESRTSGLYKDDEFVKSFKSYLDNTFFGSNLGVGFDIGFTYHVSDQIEFTGSIIDVGFINHKKDVSTLSVKGDYVFEGVTFEYDPLNPTDYGVDLEQDFRKNLPLVEKDHSYISWRPTKLNTSFRYRFGERRSKYCYDNTFKDFYRNAVGFQLFSSVRLLTPQYALTGFFESSLTDTFHTKVTYTIDNYSFHNIGIGLSSQIGIVNFYGMIDNVLQLDDIGSSNSLSVQFGINLII
jgi:hypothetical protein